jgi:anti-anti-sigma factor
MANLERLELDDLIILKLSGSLTTEGLENVEAPFEEATHKPGARVVVDLTAVEIVTTPALSMFLSAASVAKQSGGRLIFTESQPPVRDVLRRLRLHAVLRTVPGLTEAIKEARD